MDTGGATGGAGRIVSLRGVGKRLGGKTVFADLGLDLAAGGFYVALGREGSGKSTLLRILARRERVDCGNGIVAGADLRDAPAAVAVAFVAGPSPLPAHYTVGELLERASRREPGWSCELAERLRAGLRLEASRRAADLSRGENLGVGLILALAASPGLILLDDVLPALEPRARAFLLAYLGSAVRGGATVLLATALVTEVEPFATALVLMGGHTVKQVARPKALAAGYRKLRRKGTEDHEVFHREACREVGRASDGTVSYLVPIEEARAVPEALRSEEPITAVEVLRYVSRSAA